jgi:transposase
MERLERLYTADGRVLPPRLETEMLRELQRLELVAGMIKTIEAERDVLTSVKTETEHSSAKKIRDLTKDRERRARICDHPCWRSVLPFF